MSCNFVWSRGIWATRLLPQLDWTGFLRSPKWIVGFSDITALLWAAAARGVAGVHGPIVRHMPLESDASRQRLLRWCQGEAIAVLQGVTWRGGVAEGLLMPANLTVATALIGTQDWPLGEGLGDVRLFWRSRILMSCPIAWIDC